MGAVSTPAAEPAVERKLLRERGRKPVFTRDCERMILFVPTVGHRIARVVDQHWMNPSGKHRNRHHHREGGRAVAGDRHVEPASAACVAERGQICRWLEWSPEL
jgi:hypothetical protein